MNRLTRSIIIALTVAVGLPQPATLLAAESKPEVINPCPRQLLQTDVLATWTFKDGTAGWQAMHDCALRAADGLLNVQSSGDDPYFVGPAIRIEGPIVVRLRAKCGVLGDGQIFWTTTGQPQTEESRSAGFRLVHDDQWHDYSVRLKAEGTVTGLRLDPGGSPGLFQIEQIEVVREILHPLEIESVRSAGRRVSLSLKNHATEAISCSTAGQQVSVGGKASRTISFTPQGSSPFEACQIVVQADGLPPLRRSVFIADRQAGGDWITLATNAVRLRIARDGSGAEVEVQGKPAALLAPLVWRDGVVPKLTPAEPSTPRDAARFVGDGIRVDVSLAGDEIAVSIQSDKECEGPVLRALGPLQQGLLAGIEYLGQGEASSSTLDIETEEHVRFAPDPLKVTMPLMAFVTDRAALALSWRDMALQPVFATPNFIDGPEGHRAALRGKHIEAAILARGPAPLEDAILWAVKRRGLPAVPEPPRDQESQFALCMKALAGPPLRTAAGWGHCAEPSFPRHPYADFASTVWRMGGQLPPLPAVLVPGGSHVTNDCIYFVTGRARQWREMRAAEIRGILAAQQPDGSFRYDGKYRRGHFENTASGYCAQYAVRLLEHARATGDKAALEAGKKTLEFMKRFRTPRGAQTWECPLHTPDILAAAYLVQAYVRGYELTGERSYLDSARKWAISGLPFVYQWSCRPIMAYATTPVFGATNWIAPNWIGLPVQWCGYDYAYALTMLVRHDTTLPWRQVARGILVAAEQMQFPDGPYAGCLPDSFALDSQTRRPCAINPCAMVSLRLVLDGRLDSLAVAARDGHRVVAPFPLTIRDGGVHIRGRQGVTYQILVDGNRIIDVPSRGDDIVTLDRE